MGAIMKCFVGPKSDLPNKVGDDIDDDGHGKPVFIATTRYEWKEELNSDLNDFLFHADEDSDSGEFLSLIRQGDPYMKGLNHREPTAF